MISQEVITQALRTYPQYSENDECTGNIYYKAGSNIIHFEVNSGSMQQLNIYELTYKCKEFAFDNYGWMVHERKTPTGIYEYSAIHQDGRITPLFINVFDLCQHILDSQ